MHCPTLRHGWRSHAQRMDFFKKRMVMICAVNNGMMILLFNVEGEHYGINAKEVIEVIPSVALKHLPHTPECIAGLLNYRGQIVPVIDLTSLMSDHLSRDRVSSRIILINYSDKDDGFHLLGLLVEKVKSTVRIPDHMFTPSGVTTNNAPFLHDVAIYEGSMVQRINLANILPDYVRDSLFDMNKNTARVALDA